MDAHTCTICDHFYNSSVKRPLVLPCSHSFCQDCLQQLESAGDRLCPVCRKNWSDVRVADLLCCYQLIPAERKILNCGMRRTATDVLQQEDCREHQLALDLWCESCKVAACKKCWRSDHRNCDVMLLEEKCVALKKLYSSLLQPLKEEMQSKFQLYQANNKNDLELVKKLQKKLLALDKDLLEYQKSLESSQCEAAKVFATDMSLENDIQTIFDNIAVLEKFEPQMPERPTSILLPIANVHQNCGDDAEAFLSNLKIVLDVSHEAIESSIPSAEAPPSCPSLAEAVEALKDGEVWTIADQLSAAAMMSVLDNTGIRPKSVEIACADFKELKQLGIESVIGANKKYDLGIKVELDCFQHFEKPSTEAIAATKARICALGIPLGWPVLTQFSGHLDAAAVRMLPVNIKVLGLVLRDHTDMEAVNALHGTAFNTYESVYFVCNKKWQGWTDLKLSVAKTFLSDNWKTWKWGFGWESLSNALLKLGVRLHLHLPEVVPGDKRWMDGLFRLMGLMGGGFKTAVPLLLPGARIDPDALLGILRDSGQRWEVHLPTSLPQLAPREEVSERYNKYGHSVTWDLQ